MFFVFCSEFILFLILKNSGKSGGPTKAVTINQTWAQRWKTAPSPGFLAESREKRDARMYDPRNNPPPVGTYNPRDHMVNPYVRSTSLNPKPIRTRSLKILAEEARVEALRAEGKLDPDYGKTGTYTETLEVIPDNRAGVKNSVKILDFSKFPDRKGMGLQPFQEQTYLIGYDSVVNGDKLLSTNKHTFAADFTKAAKRPAQEYKSFFQAGQYKPNYDLVMKKPSVGVNFGIMPLRGAPGTRDNDAPQTDEQKYGMSHVPDRSLARNIPYLRKRYPVLDMRKMLPRPSAAKQENYAFTDNPEVFKQIYDNEMKFDICKAEKMVRKKVSAVLPMSAGPPRDKAALGTRAYASAGQLSGDVVSVEELPVEQIYQSHKRHFPVANFRLDKCRGPSHMHKTEPSRSSSRPQLAGIDGFYRQCMEGERFSPLCAPLTGEPMSKSTANVMKLRKSRSYTALGYTIKIMNKYQIANVSNYYCVKKSF